jgi:tetratricopeptide (TPR) repeat protein
VKKAPEPAIVKREAPVQPAAAPVVEEKPAVVAAKPTRRKHVREKPVAEEKAAAPIAETPVEPKRVLPPRFDRMSYATYHYNLGMELLAGGQRGRATQEFHFANTLNKWDEKTALELGNFYKEEGVFSRARKYFDLPALRKKPEIQQIQKDMADAEKQAERHRWIVFGGAAAGALLCVPALMILRRYHKKPAPLVVTSENIDEIAEQAAAEEVAAAVAEALAVDIPEPEPEEEKPFVPPPPPPPVEKLRAQPIRPLPVRPEPVQFEVVREAVEPPAPPPVIIPVPPAPEPVSVASTTAPIIEERIRERERVLEVGKVVSEALSKGHVLAGEGNIELARREYRTAAALDGQCLDAELGLAYLCFIQDQWELAMQHYVRALAINPDSPEAHYGVGRVLFETEQIDAAVPEFRKSLELDPTFQDARDALSLIEKVA